MRHTLRRVLWIGPTLAVMSVLLFAFLRTGAQSTIDRGSLARPLPRFFQPNPLSVSQKSQALVRRIAGGGSDAKAAATELVRIGGAAFPHVLPELDALPPAARARVALALAPVAKRLGLGSQEELNNPETAVLFWNRFWQDRSIDYRPGVAKRAVRRMARRASDGRREDVIGLDTYALPELIAALPSVKGPEDVERIARVSALLAHVTSLPWSLDPNASQAEARSNRQVWRRWWRDNRLDYVSLDGPERLLAMVTETQYGRWAQNAVYSRLGLTARGDPVLDVLASRAPVTLGLLVLALIAGYGAGLLVGTWSAVRRLLDRVVTPVALVLVALPISLLAGLGLADAPFAIRFGFGVSLMSLATAALLSRYQRTALREQVLLDHARTRRAFGFDELGVAWRSSRGASSAVLSLLGREIPTLMSLSFVVEYALSLPGLGPTTIAAIHDADTSWLMALGLSVMTVSALLQIASDAALARLDPRVSGTTFERTGDRP